MLSCMYTKATHNMSVTEDTKVAKSDTENVYSN